jgi:hypothetical protein
VREETGDLIVETDCGHDPDDFFTFCYLLAAGVKLRCIIVTPGDLDQLAIVRLFCEQVGLDVPIGSPRRSQLDSSFVERGTLQLKRLHRAAVIALFPWNSSSIPEPKATLVPRERRDPLKLARHYQSLLDSGKFESRAALARYLGVSRARVTQVLRRLSKPRIAGSSRNTSN